MKEKNGSNLEQAMAVLIQNQATFVANLNEVNQRFARIEDELRQIKGILVHHEQILQGLPEAIREKIGFKRQ